MKKLNDVGQALKHFYWTLLMQAAVFILLGLLILFYPAFLFIIAATAFVIVGILFLMFAWKISALISKMPDVLK